MTMTVSRPADLLGLVGADLGHTGWLEVDQARIDTFADATNDHQWIHTDPGRAADGPFGATIAHGYLTLSLVIPFIEELLQVTDKSSSINYGLDRVRFPAPVPVGSQVRMRATLDEAEAVSGGVQVGLDCVVELEGSQRPACVARAIHRHLD